ncbi:MAG: DnaJ domain-containing protein [Desulfobacteraceae bacterium]|nr:DnaJ domain-containing protein [Desulfobacteraceae bacterium]
MSLYLKTILIFIGLAYLISPFDIIPDLLLPYIGWIDDGAVIGIILYFIKYGKLPNFLYKRPNSFKQSSERNTKNFTSKRNDRQTSASTDKKTFSQNIPKTPYEILGIKPNASKKEIKIAYKKAIQKYHPDKLSHLGEEFSDLANEKFIEIQDAYNRLMTN